MISAGIDGTWGVLHHTASGRFGAVGYLPSADGEYEIAIGAVIGRAHPAGDRLVAE
jgi:hypothetical protein